MAQLVDKVSFSVFVLHCIWTLTPVDGGIAPIIVRGSKLYDSGSGERFIIKGLTFEYAVSDVYYNQYSKEAIKTKLQDLDYNTLRLYDINPDESYKSFMTDMAAMGKYVIISGSPDNNNYYGKYRYSTIDKSLGPDNADYTKTCYPALLLEYGKKILRNFAAYDNALALLVANEIMQANLKAAACVKQYVADMKSWMVVNGKKMRLIPLAYAAADSSYAGKMENADIYHVLKIQGLLCGDRMVNGMMMASIDIYLINEYRWCPGSSYAEAYQRFLTMAKGIPIVIGFGEYGCKLTKAKPRDWGMVPYLYDQPSNADSFSATFSGGLAYSYGQAKLSPDSLFPMFTGGSSEITGEPSDTVTSDYMNLKQAFAEHKVYKELAAWSDNAKCTWTPPTEAKTDPANTRATSDGWLLATCASSKLKVIESDTWITLSREGAICTDSGATCDVDIPKSFPTTQMSICGTYTTQKGGGTCNSSIDCGVKGQCVTNNGAATCQCIACYTGASCNIRDNTICSSLSSFSNAPKYIFSIASIFLVVMLAVFIALATIAYRQSLTVSKKAAELKMRPSANLLRNPGTV